MTYDEFIHVVRGNNLKLKVNSSNDAHFSSPLRSDSDPSVHVSKSPDGGVLIHDFGDPGSEDRILESFGLTKRDLYNDGQTPGYKGSRDWKRKAEDYLSRGKSRLTISDVYHYTDADSGEYVFTRLRLYDEEGKKTFRYGILKDDFFYLSGRSNSPAKVDRSTVKAVYGDLTRIKAAAAAGDRLFICEGEKDVNTLTEYGFTAFTAGGSGDQEENAAVLADLARGAEVIILADFDEAGKKAAAAVFTECQKTAKTAKVVFPDKDEKGADVTDFFKKGNKTVDQFETLIKEADDTTEAVSAATQSVTKSVIKEAEAEKKLVHVEPRKAADIAAADIPALKYPVAGMIPEGLTIIGAPPKYGKSYLMLQMGICVAAGTPFLERQTEKGDVLYIDLETSINALKPRLEQKQHDGELPEGFSFLLREDLKEANGGDMPFIFEGFEEIILDQIKSNPRLTLIIIDTMVRITPPMPRGQTQYQFESRVYDTLQGIASRNHIAIVCVTHTRKMPDVNDPMKEITGTNGVMGSGDSIIVISREKRLSRLSKMTVICRHGESFERSLEFHNGTWIDRGYTDTEEDEEENQLLRAYQASDIRTAIIEIAEKREKPWKGRAGQLIQYSVDFGVPIIAEAKTVGTFLYKNRGLFLKNDGVKLSVESSGNSNVWTIYPKFEGVENDSSTPFD